jgi:hypothetical protein
MNFEVRTSILDICTGHASGNRVVSKIRAGYDRADRSTT